MYTNPYIDDIIRERVRDIYDERDRGRRYGGRTRYQDRGTMANKYNPWQDFLREMRQQYPHLPQNELVKLASPRYEQLKREGKIPMGRGGVIMPDYDYDYSRRGGLGPTEWTRFRKWHKSVFGKQPNSIISEDYNQYKAGSLRIPPGAPPFGGKAPRKTSRPLTNWQKCMERHHGYHAAPYYDKSSETCYEDVQHRIPINFS